MTEEEAVFTMGKRFSELRNRGEDLPTERLLVGSSMVVPQDLADEYDRHFPPGPRRHKQDTDRRFRYGLVPLCEFRMGAYTHGLSICYFGREFTVLKNFEVFGPISAKELVDRVQSSKSNRYDIIRGDGFTFAIDKVEETISVIRAAFRVDDMTFCHESPIAGRDSVYIEGSQSEPIGTSHFPFVPFDRFWQVWNGYVAFRKLQIAELRDSEQIVDANLPIATQPPNNATR